jgi:eukaryotic-like serine/threonine-protein kinase
VGGLNEETYVLAAQTVLFPVETMTAAAQAQAGTRSGEVAVTNTVGRATTIVLSAESAALVQRFRDPMTLAAAVAGYGAEHRLDPHLVLDEAYPVLQHLVGAGFLVRARAEPDEVPERVGDLTILNLVQRLGDVMVLRARAPDGTDVAVKLLLDATDDPVREELRREAEVLTVARGPRVVGLVRDGTPAEQPYLATRWVDGLNLAQHAARGRRPWEATWRATALALAHEVLAAYSGLHERGILHADVHPKNVLVTPAGDVVLIDFAVARVVDHPVLGTAHRAAALPYLEPEWARTWRRGRPPPATPAGEQHAVGALLYQLFTGQHYVSTLTASGPLLERISAAPPAPFTDHGGPAWPAVEKVVARMLAKRPADRFLRLADAAIALPRPPRPRTRPASAHPGPAGLLRSTLRRLTRAGGLIDTGLTTAPRASVNYGAAGIAYFCYRLAQQRGDPALLTAARRWLAWAHRQRDDALAYQAPEIGLLSRRIGRVSIYHSPAGTACVDALVANAEGDLHRAGQMLADFVSVSQLPCASPDLTVGRAGTVVGTALLVEALGDTGLPRRHGLAAVGAAALDGLLHELPTDVAGDDGIRYRGVAHGWAGILYAALRWSEATGTVVSDLVVDRLDQLAGLRGEQGRYDIPMAGWCHGRAGTAQLWSTAFRVFGEDRFRDLTVAAAAAAWAVRRGSPTLCCGLAGQGYAMLAAHEVDGDPIWLWRAKRLAGVAARGAATPSSHLNSLWKGEVGVALLLADLADPQGACLPLFGREGWPRT